MSETLTTLDGDPVDVEQAEAQFAAAMAAPAPDRPGVASPARKPPEPDPDPEAAPYGWTYAEGEWRAKRHPGRPRTAAGDRPRVTDAKDAPRPSSASSARPAPAAAPAPATRSTNYTAAIKDTAEALWFVLAGVPVPDQAFGYKLAGVRRNLRVQAAIVAQHTPQLAAGLNLMGQHNRFMGRLLDRISRGEGALWVLPACFAIAPFVAATGQLWSGQLAEADGVDLDAIATNTEQQFAQYLQVAAQQMGAAA